MEKNIKLEMHQDIHGQSKSIYIILRLHKQKLCATTTT